MSDSLQTHGLQHTRLPCSSPTPRVYSNSCPLSQWCHPTISSSVIPFPSCLQSFAASGSFPVSQFFPSGGQSIGVSASASVLPMNIQDWFPDLHDPDNHDGVITHLEADILECEVKWALGSITTNKASEGDGIPVELFQILKDHAVKVLQSTCQQIWKTQQWPQDWKGSVFIPIPKKGNTKECSNYCTIALISQLAK